MFSNKGVLKYEQIITLKSICAVNIVAKLWINEKVELVKCVYEIGEEKNAEDIILTKIKQLRLPKAITGQLSSVVDIVKNALKSWIEFHDKYLFNYGYDKERLKKIGDNPSIKYLHLIKFMNNGMIDQLHTAKNILLKERNPKLKYKFASQYCLEEEFEHIPSKIKKKFYLSFFNEYLHDDYYYHGPLKMCDEYEYPMLFFWTYIITDDIRETYEIIMANNDFDKSLTESVIDIVLDYEKTYQSLYFEVAIKYLWSKLTNTEKSNERIIGVIEGLENSALKYSFISSLDYEQQHIIFKDISFSFLKNMLHDLMWRDRFVSTICHVLDMLDQHIYFQLLYELVEIINYHLEENDKFCTVQCYKDILKALWKQTPYAFKEYALKQRNGEVMISIAFKLKWDVSFDLIQMLLADMPEMQRRKAIYSTEGLDECIYYIVIEKWLFLDLFIKSFLVTHEDQSEFREYLVSKSLMKVCFHHLKQDNWDKIDSFLKWVFKSDDEIADFKKSVRICHGMFYYEYDIYSSRNAADKYTWNFPSVQSLNKFYQFFLKVNVGETKEV